MIMFVPRFVSMHRNSELAKYDGESKYDTTKGYSI